jgi:hypothetical protein
MVDKHLRLDSQFSTVCAFWAPDATDNAYSGTLTVDESGITFTTAPKYSRQASMANVAAEISLGGSVAARLPVLLGFTGDGLCTLCKLTEVSHPGLADFRSEQFIAATAYRAMVCVMGMHLGDVNDKCLNSARYTFSGLSEWLPSAASESWEKDYVVLKVPVNERDILAFGLRESRIEIILKVFPELTNSEVDGARLSRSVPYIEIRSLEAESLTWYSYIGNRLENLFSLLTGASLVLETMFVYRANDSGHIITKRNGHASRFDPRECVRCSASQIANSIAIWLSEPPRFRSIENLALGVLRKGKLFVETEFLSLAQALEGFHRATTQTTVSGKAAFRQVRKTIVKLLKGEGVDAALVQRICDSMSHANDPTFASRLTELCTRISGSLLRRMEIDPEQFVDNVVATRNFYTHAGGSLRMRPKRNPIEGSPLFFLNQKMRALLRGVMLLHIGIPETQFAELLASQATRWR